MSDQIVIFYTNSKFLFKILFVEWFGRFAERICLDQKLTVPLHRQNKKNKFSYIDC